MNEDRVEVSFVYQGRQIETRFCPRSQADKWGRQMVTIYAGMLNGSYRIRELPNTNEIKVNHYFIEVT